MPRVWHFKLINSRTLTCFLSKINWHNWKIFQLISSAPSDYCIFICEWKTKIAMHSKLLNMQQFLKNPLQRLSKRKTNPCTFYTHDAYQMIRVHIDVFLNWIEFFAEIRIWKNCQNLLKIVFIWKNACILLKGTFTKARGRKKYAGGGQPSCHAFNSKWIQQKEK